MVRVVINNRQGLVQKAGGGVALDTSVGIGGAVTGSPKATGMEFISLGAVQSLNSAADYDDTHALPAGATITDCGFTALTICTTDNNSAADQIEFKFGTTEGGVDLIALTDVCEANKSLVAGASMSAAMGNTIEATATSLASAAGEAFADAVLLRDAAGAARSVYTRFVVASSALATPGTVRAWVKYIIT